MRHGLLVFGNITGLFHLPDSKTFWDPVMERESVQRNTSLNSNPSLYVYSCAEMMLCIVTQSFLSVEVSPE
jgi:hypothetical protein